jgi:segregation and condensation protein B
MTNTKTRNIIEAMLFSSERPLSSKEIKDIVNLEKDTTGLSIDIKTIESSLEELMEKYQGDEYSFALVEIAGGYRFATKKGYSPWLAKLNKEKLRRKLSQSALETLAIIAYNQPITRAEIENIRGVNVDYIVGALLEKNLITIRGRAEAPGRPMLFGTTPDMLEYLGLRSLNDLPPLKEIEDVIKLGPPEGVTQSDIDFFEEINLMRSKLKEGEEISLPAQEQASGDSESENGIPEANLEDESQSDSENPGNEEEEERDIIPEEPDL